MTADETAELLCDLFNLQKHSQSAEIRKLLRQNGTANRVSAFLAKVVETQDPV